MFTAFETLALNLKNEFANLYWILLVPVTLIVLILEFLKEGPPMPGRVIKRMIFSVILLISFDLCAWVIVSIGDGISKKIDGMNKLSELASILGKSIKEIDMDWFSIRTSLIRLLGLLSYMLAFVGVFTAEAVIQFAWAILYSCSPFMILAFVSEKTASVTGNLYKGMVHVSLWNVMASILGVLLLEFVKTGSYGQENLLTVIIINLCIAVSLLMVPYTVKSLVNDGMIGASALSAAVPGLAISKEFTKRAKAGIVKTEMTGKRFAGKTAGSAIQYAGRGLKKIRGVKKEESKGVKTRRKE